jgi:5-amino-6-(5-phosphoribosylamino)uracil reductase
MKIINVMAISLDGSIASKGNERDSVRKEYGFLAEEDRRHVLSLLADADAVIAGGESIRCSGGAFDLVNHKGVSPKWMVLTNQGLPETLRFWQQDKIDRWLISEKILSNVPAHRGEVTNFPYGEGSPAELIRKKLIEANCEKVLLFGGGRVNQLFYEAGLVDELIVTICPVIFGTKEPIPLVSPTLTVPVRLTLQTSNSSENLVFLKYIVNS